MTERMRMHYQTAVTDRLVAADTVDVLNLGVNPLSALFLKLMPLNETSTLGNYKRAMDIAAAVNQLRILYRGQSVMSLRGEDLYAMNLLRRGVELRDVNTVNTDNVRRCVTLPIMFSRFFGDPTECFPASKSGDLTIEIDWDIADSGYDGMRFSIESGEILGARPTHYERCISINKTFSATGQQDTALPIGNDLRGILLFGTTGFAGASPAPSWGRVELLIDNQQYQIAGLDFELAMTLNGVLGRRHSMYDAHQHTSATTSPTTSGFDHGLGGSEKYAFIDFDVLRNDMYSVPTVGANSVILRAIAETADAVRCIPVERVVIGP